MLTLTLKIPKRTSDNFGEPIKKFIDFIGEVNNFETQIEILEFDFSETKFISPFLISGLVYLANHHQIKGGQCKVIFRDFSDSKSYLETVKFYEGFNYHGLTNKSIEDFFAPYHQKNHTPIINFPTSVSSTANACRENIISALNKILKNQLKLTGELAAGIYYLIDELTQNIVDHSGSTNGSIFAQFFISKNFMDVCIWDNGKGLLNSYIESGKHNPKSHSEAINFAVYGKSTKNIPESRGFGLSTSKKMLVKGLKGKFFIFSGDSFFLQTHDKEEVITIPQKYSVNGCYLALRIPILSNEKFNFYEYLE